VRRSNAGEGDGRWAPQPSSGYVLPRGVPASPGEGM
jgi:hypothetical protein